MAGGAAHRPVVAHLKTVLGAQGPTHAAEASYNNHWGVPLTLARMPADTQFAVIEIGMNHPGEIAYLSNLARPDLALITSVGRAHLEGFGSLEGVARAKGEIIQGLPEDGTLVVPADSPWIGLWREAAGQRRVLTFGFTPDADVSADPAP